jgi:hypothetical protein
MKTSKKLKNIKCVICGEMKNPRGMGVHMAAHTRRGENPPKTYARPASPTSTKAQVSAGKRLAIKAQIAAAKRAAVSGSSLETHGIEVGAAYHDKKLVDALVTVAMSLSKKLASTWMLDCTAHEVRLTVIARKS